jgi:dihydroorotate dehydrogenase electron transfer subunit
MRDVGEQRIKVEIVENTALIPGVFRLILRAAEEGDDASRFDALALGAAPGAFVNVYMNNRAMLLPRPLGISDVTWVDRQRNAARRSNRSALVTLVYAVVGSGTAELSTYGVGQTIETLGPQGTGFNLTGLDRHMILIGGGLGIPPLLFAAHRLREEVGKPDARRKASAYPRKLTALLGFRDAPYYREEMLQYCDDVRFITESGFAAGSQGRGTVLDLIRALTVSGDLDLSDAAVLSCGPAPMLRAVSEWADSYGLSTQISMESRMGCGYGACVGCTIETTAGRKKVCVDGPVFPAGEILWV